MIVLPDSSIWIDFFRGRNRRSGQELERLVRRGSVVVCGPVLAELLAGTPADRQDELWVSMSSLPWAELPPDAWREVGATGAALRAGGHWLPRTDVAIAVAAKHARAALWSRDRDFQRIREVLPGLELHKPA